MFKDLGEQAVDLEELEDSSWRWKGHRRTSKDIEGQYVKSQDMDSDSKSYQKIQQVQSVPIPIYSNNRCRIRLIQAPIQADSRTACRNGPTGTREALPIKGQEHRGTSPVTPVMGSEIWTMET